MSYVVYRMSYIVPRCAQENYEKIGIRKEELEIQP